MHPLNFSLAQLYKSDSPTIRYMIRAFIILRKCITTESDSRLDMLPQGVFFIRIWDGYFISRHISAWNL